MRHAATDLRNVDIVVGARRGAGLFADFDVAGAVDEGGADIL